MYSAGLLLLIILAALSAGAVSHQPYPQHGSRTTGSEAELPRKLLLAASNREYTPGMYLWNMANSRHKTLTSRATAAEDNQVLKKNSENIINVETANKEHIIMRFPRKEQKPSGYKREDESNHRFKRATSKFTGLVVGAYKDNTVKQSVVRTLGQVEANIWGMQSQFSKPFIGGNLGFSVLLGAFNSELRTNFHGYSSESSLRRSSDYSVYDLNSLTTLLILECLTEASLYGIGGTPALSNMTIAVESLKAFHSHIYSRGSSVLTMWPERFMSDSKVWANTPENIIGAQIKDNTTFNQLQQLAKSCNCEPARSGVQVMTQDKLCADHFATPLSDLFKDTATPPDFTTSFSNLALGSLLHPKLNAKNSGVYKAQFDLWLSANSDIQVLINTLKAMVIILPEKRLNAPTNVSAHSSDTNVSSDLLKKTIASITPADVKHIIGKSGNYTPANVSDGKVDTAIVHKRTARSLTSTTTDTLVNTTISEQTPDTTTPSVAIAITTASNIATETSNNISSNTDTTAMVTTDTMTNSNVGTTPFDGTIEVSISSTAANDAGMTAPNISTTAIISNTSALIADSNSVITASNDTAVTFIEDTTVSNNTTASSDATTTASRITTTASSASATASSPATSVSNATTTVSSTTRTVLVTETTAQTTTVSPTVASTSTEKLPPTDGPASRRVNQILNSKSYSAIRNYLDEVLLGENREVILIPSLISDNSNKQNNGQTPTHNDGNIWHNGQLFHSYNNVNLMTTAITIHALVVGSLSGMVDIQNDVMLQRIVVSSLRLLTWYMNNSQEVITMVTLSEFPSRYHLYWMTSRIAFQLNSKQAQTTRMFQFADKAIPPFLKSLRDKMTFSILQSITDGGLGQDGKTRVYVDDFIGVTDFNDKGEKVASGDDRLFTCSLAISALINTWTVQSTEGYLEFVKEIGDPVHIAINSLANYVSGAVLDQSVSTLNSFMSEQIKNCETLPARYPANIITLPSGEVISPTEPTNDHRFGVKGHIPMEDYQKLLDQAKFGYKTRGGNIDDLNSPTSVFRFWTSAAFTKAITYQAIAMAANLQTDTNR